jgi:hypothetical protein
VLKWCSNGGQMVLKWCSNGGQTVVKSWSDSGQMVLKWWSNGGQMVVKRWSNRGQMVVKSWSNGGQAAVQCRTPFGVPPSTPRASAGSVLRRGCSPTSVHPPVSGRAQPYIGACHPGPWILEDGRCGTVAALHQYTRRVLGSNVEQLSLRDGEASLK